MLQLLLLVIRVVELLLAILLLGIVIHLFLLEHLHHLVDHADNLAEIYLLPRQRHRQQVELRVAAARMVAAGLRDGAERALAQLVAVGHLDEARALRGRQGLFEKVEGVVVVEELDDLCQGEELLGARLAALLPLAGLRGAAFLQLGQELLVLCQGLLRERQVVLHLHDGHPELPDPAGLGLDGLGAGIDLLRLGLHELLEGRDGLLLCFGRVGQGLGHVLRELLEDAGNLPALGRVLAGLASGEEREDRLPVVLEHVRAGGGQPLQALRQISLQQGASHALLEGGHRLVDGIDVGVGLGLECRKGRRLLLPDRSSLRDGLLGVRAVHLRLLQRLLQLRLLLLGALDVRRQLRRLGLGCADGTRELPAGRLTVAHELLVQLLLPLALLRDLLLHGLQHGDHFANRVGLAGLGGAGEPRGLHGRGQHRREGQAQQRHHRFNEGRCAHPCTE
mmetsp:Transcript_33665/g.88159  ORF Transcript_33665/g.88159 Transcript_33665/m.88159 type:complete len:450 (+) Transcript_33665:880-2229(+)